MRGDGGSGRLTVAQFRNLCDRNGLSFTIDYSEAEGLFYVRAYGAGEGEDFYAKKISRLEDAFAYIVRQMRDSPLNFEIPDSGNAR